MSNIVFTSGEFDRTPDAEGAASEYGTRILAGQLAPAEEDAAKLSGNPARWQAEQVLVARYAHLFGDPMSEVRANLQAYTHAYHGEALEPEAALKRVLSIEGQPPATSLQAASPPAIAAPSAGKPRNGEGDGPGFALFRELTSRIDAPLAELIGQGSNQKDKDEAAYDGWVPSSRNDTRWNDAARQIVGGAASSVGAVGTFGLRLAGMKETADELEGYLSAFARANGPTEAQAKNMKEASGTWGQLSLWAHPETYTYNICGAIGTSVPFAAGGIGMAAALRGSTLSPWLLRVLPGVAGGVGEAASEAGTVGVGLVDKGREYQQLLDLVEGMPEKEANAVLMEAIGQTHRDIAVNVANLKDNDYRQRYIDASFHRNLPLNALLGAFEFGMASKFVETIAAGGKARAVGFALVEGWSQLEQEHYQNTFSTAVMEAAVKNAAVRISLLGLMPVRTVMGFIGQDPEALDTAIACIGIMGRSTAISMWDGLARAKTLEQQVTFWKRNMMELDQRAQAGDLHAKALLDTLATDKTGIAAVNHYTRVLHEKAKEAAEFAQARSEQAATPAEAAQINPDDALTTATMQETGAALDEVQGHADAADLAAEGEAMGVEPVAVEAASVADPLAGHVAFVQSMVDSLNQAAPGGAQLELVRRADLPPDAVAAAGAGNEVHSWYDPGTNKIYLVAEALAGKPNTSLAVVEAFVLGKWAHEQAHVGARLLLGHTEAERDAFLVGLGQMIAPEKTASMLGRTGLSPEEVAANPQHAMAVSVEEYLARIAEAKVSGQGAALDAKQAKVWQRVKDWIKQGARNLARSAGMRLELTDAEAERWAMRMFARGVAGEAPAAAAAPAARRGFNPKNILEQNADIMPVCAEVARRGGIRTTAGAGETDGRPDMQALAPFGPALFSRKETAQAPDQMLHDLAGEERAMFGANDPVSALWERMAGEVEGYRKARANDKQQAAEDKQAAAFAKDAMEPGTRMYPIPVAKLNDGDVVMIGKEAMTAKVLHDEDGNVTGVVLQGGDKYGAQELGNDAVIYSDAKPTPAVPGAASDGLRFKIEPKGDGQLKTPQFKAWFGDWEAAANVKRVLELTPVEASARQLSNDEAVKSYKAIGKQRNDATGVDVEFVNNSLWKIIRHKGFDGRVIPSLAEAFKRAVPAFDEAVNTDAKADGTPHKTHTNISGYSHFIGKVKMDGREFFVRFTVQNLKTRKAERNSQFHSAFVSDVTLYENTTSGVKSMNDMATSDGGVLLDNKLAQWLSSVKPGDVSAVVDANGKPMVVWHGGRKFDVFNATEESGANFAIADEDAAQTYADQFRDGEVKPLFLNIRNPKIIEGAMPRSGDPVFAELRAAGFDGVIATDTDSGNKGKYKAFAFFDSAQAKLAPVDHDSSWGTPVRNEGNTGAFNPKNRDIRYSIEPVAAPTLGHKEKLLSAVVTRGIFNGKPVGERFVANRLTEMGLDPKHAPAVLLYGKLKAEQWRQELGALRNDDQLLPALATNHLKERYAGNIESAHGVGEEQGRMLAKQFAGIAEWNKRRAEQFAESRRGLSDTELEAAGAVNLRKRLDNVVADFAPEAKAKRKVALPDEAPADLMPQGQADEQQGQQPPLDELAAESAADLDAEAAALAPLPAKLPTDPVDVAALKTLVVAVATKKLEAAGHKITNKNWDYALRKEVAATYARLLREAAHEHIPAGAARERAMLAAQDMAAHPPTMETLHKHFSRQVYFVSRAAARADVGAFGRKIDRLLKLKAVAEVTGARTEEIKRLIAPATKAWLRLVRDVYDATEEMADTMKDGVKGLAERFDHGNLDTDQVRDQLAAWFPSMGKEPHWKTVPVSDALEDALRALALYGAVKSRTPAEVQTALAQLQRDYETGIQDILDKRLARAARLGPVAEALRGAVQRLPDRPKEGLARMAESWWRGNFGFFNGMMDLIRHENGAHYQAAEAAIKNLSEAVEQSTSVFEDYVARSRQALETAVKQIYGRNPATVLRELAKDREDFRKFSMNPERTAALSKGNLIAIVAMLTQKNYADKRPAAYLAEVHAALSPQDLKLLDWLRGWYESTRAEVSAHAMQVLGVPVLSPDPLYHPARVARDASGLAEFHYTLQLAPETFEHRRRNKWDIDEKADALGMFHLYAEKNGRFLGYSRLGQDLRYVFGNADVRRSLTAALGPVEAGRVIQHVTEVAAGKAQRESDSSGFMASARAATTLMVMSGNVGAAMRQLSAVPAFLLGTDGPAEVATALAMPLAAPAQWLEAWNEVRANPAFRQWVSMGYSDAVTQAMRNEFSNPVARSVVGVLRFGLRVQSLGIAGSVALVAPGVYVARTNAYVRAGMSLEGAKARAMNETLWLVNHTQGSNQIQTFPRMWINQHETIRTLMQFQGPVAQLWEWEARAFRDLKAGAPGSGKRLLNTILVNHVLVPGAYMALKALWMALRGDFKDDPEDEAWKLANESLLMCILGPTSGILFAGGLIEGVVRNLAGMSVQRDGSVPVVSALGRVGKNTVALIKHAATDYDWGTMWTDWDRVMSSASAPWRDASKAVKNYSE